MKSPYVALRCLAALIALNGVSLVAAQPSDLKACVEQARRAGVPKALASSMYLNEWNSPTYFAGIACEAARTGAKFRFSAGGLFGDDSFSVTGKNGVRVWVSGQKMGDGSMHLLVPVEYEVNGYVFGVTRANIQELSFLIRQALSNE